MDRPGQLRRTWASLEHQSLEEEQFPVVDAPIGSCAMLRGPKCMGITCSTVPSTSSFSTGWARFTCKTVAHQGPAPPSLGLSAAGHVSAAENTTRPPDASCTRSSGSMCRWKGWRNCPPRREPVLNLSGSIADAPRASQARQPRDRITPVFPSVAIDGWIAARPDEFAPGFIECWKAVSHESAQPIAETSRESTNGY